VKVVRFDALDGLRGIAAFAVLVMHVTPHNAINITPHAPLAVDFFFGLSGFVIAAAYGARIEAGMPLKSFMWLRLVRLYPLIVLGAVIGAAGYIRLYDSGMLALLFVTGVLMIPTPYGAVSEDQCMYALNVPSWSLLWELLVNLLYGVIAPVLHNRTLAGIVVISAVALAATGLHYGTLDVGAFWRQGWAGLPRVMFSFFTGVGVYRLRQAGLLARLRAPAWVTVLALCGILAMPRLGAWNGLYDVVAAIVALPLLVALGANVTVTRTVSLCRMLGNLSYPVYILQGGISPHLRGLAGHLRIGGLSATLLAVLMSIGFTVFAWVALKTFDEPVRKWVLGRNRIPPAVKALG
jgi:peptidoglycan/LPS O-acetylase OafA/YrhL